MTDYTRIRWDSIKEYGESLILIDIERPMDITQLELDGELKKSLLVVDQYISHNSNTYGQEGIVTVYDIKNRAIDNKGNLILFVKNNNIRYPR